jgi:WD40 repeat protein
MTQRILLLLLLLSLTAFLSPTYAQTLPKIALSSGIAERSQSVAINADETIAAVAGGSSLYFHALPSGELIQKIPGFEYGIRVLFDAQDNVIILSKEKLIFFNTKAFEIVKEVSVPELSAYWLSPDRARLVVAGERAGSPTIWEVDTDNQRARIKYTHRSESTDTPQTITHLSLADSKDLAFVKFNTDDALLLKTGNRWASVLEVEDNATLYTLLPEGDLLQLSSDANTIHQIARVNPVTRELTQSFPVNVSAYGKDILVKLPELKSNRLTIQRGGALLYLDLHTDQTGVLDNRSQSLQTATAFPQTDRVLTIRSGSFDSIIAQITELPNQQVTHTIERQLFSPSRLIGHPTETTVYAEDPARGLKRIEISNDRLSVTSFSGELAYQPAQFVTQKNSLFAVIPKSPAADYDGTSHDFQALTADLKPATALLSIDALAGGNTHQNLNGFIPSESGERILIQDIRGTQLINQQGRTLWKNNDRIDFLVMRPVVSERLGLVVYYSKDDQLKSIDLQTGRVNWSTPASFSHAVFNQKTMQILTLWNRFNSSGEFARRDHAWYDAKTGKQIQTKNSEYAKPIYKFTQSTDGQLIALGSLEDIEVLATDSLLSLTKIEATSRDTFHDLAFMGNNHYLVSITFDNQLVFWDLLEQQELARLRLLQSDSEWLVTDTQGRFDAPEITQDKLNYAINLALVPLTAYFDNYFRPRFLSDLLARRSVEPATLDLAALVAPPEVKVSGFSTAADIYKIGASNVASDPALTLNIASRSPASPITEYRVFQNGKRVAANTRGLFVEEDPIEETDASYTGSEQIPSQLLPGINRFEVVAVNAQGIESAPSAIEITYDAPANQKTTLHLLVVGINQYENEKYNLNYAVADAAAFKDKVATRGAPLFDQLSPTIIKDSEVTKARIKKELFNIRNTALPQDVFIFYYAGHGMVTDQGRGDFYIVPTDVTQLYGADEQMTTRGLSSSELQELSQSIPAQKQLFILDACQAGGALTGISQRGAAEEKAIAQLARSTGTHWLTASGSQQFATEFADLGHGAFTYTLLNGLAGKADSGDGRVTVNELKAYLESEVPVVTAKHKGTAQYPASYGYGQDFPITLP